MWSEIFIARSYLTRTRIVQVTKFCLKARTPIRINVLKKLVTTIILLF